MQSCRKAIVVIYQRSGINLATHHHIPASKILVDQEMFMNTSLLRKIVGLILAALLLTSILLLAGTTAAAQRRYRRHHLRNSFSVRLIAFEPDGTVQQIPPFSAFGPFGRPYHPYWDPYGSYDHNTFYRHSFFRKRTK